MTRLRITAASALTSLAALAPAAPGPKNDKPALYLATAKGTAWTYAVGESEHTDVVTGVEKKADGAVLVTVAREGRDGAAPYSVVEATAWGLYEASSGTAAFDPPRCPLRLQAKPGDAWETDAKPARLKGKYVLKGEEEVEVPAGRFKVLRVEAVVDVRDGPRPMTLWYAAGVGRVRTAMATGGAEQVEVLKAFTPGKD
jgi:hypothetical protein